MQLLQHIARYRMSTPDVLATQPFFADGGMNAVKNVTRRLLKGRFIGSASLYGRLRYYHLTAKSAAILGLHERAGQWLTEDAKIRAYSCLRFCCDVREPRKKLTAEEFRTSFASLTRSGERLNYFISTANGKSQLGYMRTDYSPHGGRWDRIIAKCQKDVEKRCDNPEFRQLIDAGLFLMAVLTALPQKAERLNSEFQKRELPCCIRAYAVPGLLDLIAPVRLS